MRSDFFYFLIPTSYFVLTSVTWHWSLITHCSSAAVTDALNKNASYVDINCNGELPILLSAIALQWRAQH
jgi:hypothetical protein